MDMHSLLGRFGQDEYFKAVSPGSYSCPATTLRSVVQAGAGECNARPLFCVCPPALDVVLALAAPINAFFYVH